jgi:hypothetical protein
VLASAEEETRRNVMLLPTRIIHYVMILNRTLLITRVLPLIKNNISSFDNVSVSTFNEPQNVDLTTEIKKEAEGKEIKIAVPLEWERNKTKLLRNAGHGNGNFEGDTEICARKLLPSCGATGG